MNTKNTAPTEKSRFVHSLEFKRIFNSEFEKWKKRHKGTLEELAQIVGVSTSYLGHVGRYGRVPGKPILTLLALVLEIDDPVSFFRAALIEEPWPFDGSMRIAPLGAADEGLLSVKLDMNGFTKVIREIVRSEVAPRTLKSLLRGKPLRVGLNLHQKWNFGVGEKKEPIIDKGFVPELLHLLGVSLRIPFTVNATDFGHYSDALEQGEIDLYGPVYVTHRRISEALHSVPIFNVGLSALLRKNEARDLAPLPAPRTGDDLIKQHYQLSVLRNSQGHHFASVELGRSDESLILCDSSEEAIERIVMRGIKRPAHLMLCDTTIAVNEHALMSKDTELLFAEPGKVLATYPAVFAIRSDWPELKGLLDESLKFLSQAGTLKRLLAESVSEKYQPYIEIVR